MVDKDVVASLLDSDSGSEAPFLPTENDSQDWDVEKAGSKLKFSDLTGRRRYILCLCTLANLFSGCSFSIMAPFYPREAHDKGMEPAAIGFIFSIFELIIFISSPIIGNYLATIGPRSLYMTGIFLGGTCNILFGLTHFCPANIPFIALSFVTRSLEAFGFSCYVNTSFAIVSSEFPKHVSTVFGILQTATGTGLMLGPVIGGILYELGGFGLPFYVIGSAVLVSGVFVYSFLPEVKDKNSFKRSKSMVSLMWNPKVLIPMLSVCASALGITFLEPTLAKHLASFHLATFTASLFFVIPPLMNTFTSPVWGYLTDSSNIQGPLLMLGHLFYSIGFLIMGPCPFLPFIPFDISTVTLGLVLVGTTLACTLIAAMKSMVLGVLESGCDDNIDTYGVVGGLFNCVYTLGGCFGPMLGGVMGQHYGLSLSFTVVGFISAAMALVTLLFFLIERIRHTNTNNTSHDRNLPPSTFPDTVYQKLNALEEDVPFKGLIS